MARDIAQSLAGKAAVVQVNTEESPRTAGRMGVRGIPAFFALNKGSVVASTSGAQSKDQLIWWFLEAVK